MSSGLPTLDAETKLAIHELLARAAFALDHREDAMLAGCFAEQAKFSLRIADGDLIGPFETREGIMGLMRGAWEEQTDVRKHAVSNIFFPADEQRSDAICVVSNLALMSTENGVISLVSAGVYKDWVIHTEDGWLLLERHLDLDLPY
jgi:3-phenylpropionate/cinnamic acid dioxygenase small subunit